MPLLHRRTIIKEEILEEWIERGRRYTRYRVIWSDGEADICEGYTPLQGCRLVKQERIAKEETPHV